MSNKNPLTDLTNQQILAEIEDVLRHMPARDQLHWDTPEVLAWLGRATAVIEHWSFSKSTEWSLAVNAVRTGRMYEDGPARVQMLLHQAQHDLRLKVVGPGSVAIAEGGVFDYFDEIRGIIETATEDILFVDPYLDAEFISRYLPHVKPSVNVRLLGSKHIDKLASAAALFSQQAGISIDVRRAKLHDRYVFIDRQRCFSSGASFKDGAKRTGTTITENIDAFEPLLKTYEGLWDSDDSAHETR